MLYEIKRWLAQVKQHNVNGVLPISNLLYVYETFIMSRCEIEWGEIRKRGGIWE